MSSILTELKPAKGAIKKRFKKGRGITSGSGKTCGRGHRGQRCRSGFSQDPRREGGQTPLYRRLPKRQLNSRPNRKEFSVVNLCDLQDIVDIGITEIDEIVLLETGKIKTLAKWGVKVLANGQIKKAITVRAQQFSTAAKEAIEKAGGTATVISSEA